MKTLVCGSVKRKCLRLFKNGNNIFKVIYYYSIAEGVLRGVNTNLVQYHSASGHSVIY